MVHLLDFKKSKIHLVSILGYLISNLRGLVSKNAYLTHLCVADILLNKIKCLLLPN